MATPQSIKIRPGDAPLATTGPTVAVDTTGMAVGRYTFSLTVKDTSGASSVAATCVVVIQAQPVAVITGPASVGVNQAITLDGSTSTDPGGTIGSYLWSVTPAPATTVFTPNLTGLVK